MSVSSRTIKKFIANDQKATEKVYLEYKNLMYFIIASYVSNKSDCDDILSDAFMKAMEKRHEIKDPTKLKAFLSSIAKNEALNFLKKYRDTPNSEIIDQLYTEDDRSNDFLSLIEPLLTNKETIVVYLKVGFSYTWNEISEETGISESTARRIYESAKEKLQKGLTL